MNSDILRENKKIIIKYVMDGRHISKSVNLRYMDTSSLYFATSDIGVKFTKPKNKLPLEIYIYTCDGIYYSNTLFNDNTSVTLQEVIFAVNVPKIWQFIQRRNSSRLDIEIPLKIEFEDGYLIDTFSIDIASQGVSFLAKKDISSIYQKLKANITLKLPHNNASLDNNLYEQINTTGQYARSVQLESGYFKIAFKFLNIQAEQEKALKQFLLQSH